MKFRMFVLGIAAFLIFTSVIASFAQEQAAELENQWLWGEIDSVDIQENEVMVRYLDYDTEQEKEINITVDEKTIYENVDSLLDIKPRDAVSVNYLILPEGKNLAKNISVENPETASPETGGQ